MKGLKLPVDLFHVRSPGHSSRVGPRATKETKAYFCGRGVGGGANDLPPSPTQGRPLQGGEKAEGGGGNAGDSSSDRLRVSPCQ